MNLITSTYQLEGISIRVDFFYLACGFFAYALQLGN